MDADGADPATSFGQAADLYDRVRPGYPAEAVRWLLEPLGGSGHVVDLGAGTGKLTRTLADGGPEARGPKPIRVSGPPLRGYKVSAVEPDPQMRATLAAATPGVEVLAGTGDGIPLPDGSVDAVLAGQSYHWFAGAAAHAEIARVLRPGGVFAPVWNFRDESEPWVARMSEIVNIHDAYTADYAGPDLPAAEFAPAETGRFRWRMPMTPGDLLDLVRSRSYYLAATADARARMDDGIRRLCAEHPDLAGRDTFEMPYVTVGFRAIRR